MLYVKDSDTQILGVLANAPGVIQLTTKGDSLVLGDFLQDSQEPAEICMNLGQPLFVDYENGIYSADALECVDEETGERHPINLPESHNRILTPAIDALWRKAVVSYQTTDGLREWADELSEAEYLKAHGLYLSARDWRFLQAFDGAYQIAAHYEPGLVTEEAVDFFGHVGDDLQALAELGFAHIRKTSASMESESVSEPFGGAFAA
jgi:hypothetical protein